MKPRDLLGCVLILVLFSSSGADQEAKKWKVFSSFHEYYHEYYDQEGVVTTQEGTKKVPVKATFDDLNARTGKEPHTIESLVEINCNDKTYRLLSLTRFYSGNKTEEDKDHINQWEKITADSNRENLYNIVCEKMKKDKKGKKGISIKGVFPDAAKPPLK